MSASRGKVITLRRIRRRSGLDRAARSAVTESLKLYHEPPAILWLIRHAEVDHKYQRVFGGRIDMELSARGHRQAAALAGYLVGKGLDAVYASPMRRVQQTLAAFQGNGMPKPSVLAALREVDFGDWTGLAYTEVRSKFGVSPDTWLTQLECAGIDKAECASSLRARLEPCLHGILLKHRGQQVALFCHGGVIRVLLAILLGWPLSQLAAIEIDYASVTQVVWSNLSPRVQLLNFCPWRDLPS